MVNIEKTTDYKKYVELAINSDNNFFKVYKKEFKLKTENECISNEIMLYNSMNNFDFYVIYNDDKFSGYFGGSGSGFKYLTTFFINKEFRNKDFYKEFLSYMYEKLGDTFCAYRVNRNFRSERFLIELGGTTLVDTAKHRLYLFNNRIQE